MKNVKVHKKHFGYVFGLLFLCILLCSTLTFAENITFSLDQKDFYFLVGERAAFPLHVNSTYGDATGGQFTYTISQQINQGNYQYSNSNTQSQSFNVPAGNNDISMDFGTADSPQELIVDLQFFYSKSGNSDSISLNQIHIFFVQNESQKNNQQNQQQSTSSESQNQNNNQNQNQQSQQNQQSSSESKEPKQPSNQMSQTEQKLQNNQMSQDSSALKQQMQEQVKEQQAKEQAFQQALEQNEELKQAQQELQDQGFKETSSHVDPTNNNTGNFEKTYQNKDGETATLSGNMQNGSMSELQKDTPKARQEALDALQQNDDFKKYDEELKSQGYEQTGVEYSFNNNQTQVKMQYQKNESILNGNNNQTQKNSQTPMNNQTAEISADIINQTVQNVELKKEDEEDSHVLRNLVTAFVVLILLGVFSYILYKRYLKKKIKNSSNSMVAQIVEKPFDYKNESLKLLKKAQHKFDEEEFKEAYALAGQSFRLYLRYKNKLHSEVTNDEIILFLKTQKKSSQKIKEIKQCFDLCSLVEFAKYKPNKTDFKKIVKFVKKSIL